MKNDLTFPSSDGQTKIHAIEWLPDGEPTAVLQICHGMCEFIDRYDAFARFMAGHGFYVVGNDHLGHGASVTEDSRHGYFAKEDGNGCVLSDLHTLREMTETRFPGLPYFWIGHSMGSFLTRQYIARHGEGLAGAVIMGTGSQPGAVLAGGKAICGLLSAFRGEEYRSPLLTKMSFGAYNERIDPLRTKSDWLTKDEDIVDAYNANPWCTFAFTVNGYRNLFLSISDCQDRKTVAKIPKNLPLLLVSGAEDPVGKYGADVDAVTKAYREAGILDVTEKLYPGDRHEILNELDRETVYEDLLRWMTERMPKA